MLVLGVFLLLPIFSLQARPQPSTRQGARASGASCSRLLGSPLVECVAGQKEVDLIEMEVRDVIPLTTADTHAVVLICGHRPPEAAGSHLVAIEKDDRRRWLDGHAQL